jgi:hypothetical protein
MSSFVLNRNCQLELPTNFVEIDRDEMEYVDGGYAVPRWLLSNAINSGLTLLTGGSVGLVAAYCRRQAARAGEFAAAEIISRTVRNALLRSQFSYSVAGTVSSVISSGFTVLMWALDPGSAICGMMCQRAGYPKDNYWVPIN